ncbi:MAG: SDR family NAD(P)-dependent oxidoreductase [Firmicutes bacterium]|nr:SDR family NAD(P)-dependent oxidoreductase [Bacillota bacterium]
MRLSNKYVVVTGGTSGLGLAMARALLQEGATVAIAARPGPRLEMMSETLKTWASRLLCLPMDVRDVQSVERAREVIAEAWPKLDLVVNNAGIGMRTVNPLFLTQPQPFFEVDPEGFEDVVRTNLTGYFFVSRAFASLFRRQGYGRFVNVTMNRETMVRRGFVPYGPSRAGAEAFSYIMVEDLKPFGITVNLLLPGGATRTGMIPEGTPPEALARMRDPEIMGPPIVFLASDAAEGMTGERIDASQWEAWCQAHGVDREWYAKA